MLRIFLFYAFLCVKQTQLFAQNFFAVGGGICLKEGGGKLGKQGRWLCVVAEMQRSFGARHADIEQTALLSEIVIADVLQRKDAFV